MLRSLWDIKGSSKRLGSPRRTKRSRTHLDSCGFLLLRAGYEGIDPGEGEIGLFARSRSINNIEVLQSVVGLGAPMVRGLVSMFEYFMAEPAKPETTNRVSPH